MDEDGNTFLLIAAYQKSHCHYITRYNLNQSAMNIEQKEEERLKMETRQRPGENDIPGIAPKEDRNQTSSKKRRSTTGQRS